MDSTSLRKMHSVYPKKGKERKRETTTTREGYLIDKISGL